MKKNTGLAILLSFFVLLAMFIGINFSPITPWGGTRLSIFFSGYPINAIFTGLEYHDDGDGDRYYVLSFPPYAIDTGSELYQWNIRKSGIFYWAVFGVA